MPVFKYSHIGQHHINNNEDALLYYELSKERIHYEYEQENKPDYMAYHLNKPFEDWYEGHTSKLTLTNVPDLSLTTDGIFTFRPYDTAEYPMISDVEITNLLLNDVAGKDNPLMLQNKCYILKKPIWAAANR